MKFILISVGFGLLVFEHYLKCFEGNLPFIIFFAGILFLGIPHGAADVIVASSNAKSASQSFSIRTFLAIYLGRIAVIAGILFFFPLLGNLIFILFAAYHFGETDLNQFKLTTLSGKLLVTSYGLVILGSIILIHFEESQQILTLFESAKEYTAFMEWIRLHRFEILGSIVALFSTSVLWYFQRNKDWKSGTVVRVLFQFIFLLFILSYLPMMLGFTFYFVIWHSLISITNIVGYVKKVSDVPNRIIIRQIVFYSSIAFSGIFLFGWTGFMFLNYTSVSGHVFLALAVLTAPHMAIMSDMYSVMRDRKIQLA